MLQKFFKRFEIKYQISLQERDNFIAHIKPFMHLDSHTSNNFSYEVRSLYFDSRTHHSYFQKNNGTSYRKKLRIRYYPDFQSIDGETVFIEIKKKNNENVSKSRIVVPFADAMKIIDNHSQESQIFYQNSSIQDKRTLSEIWLLVKKHALTPVCVVSYKRQAFVGLVESRFRLTFDTNIKVRKQNYDLHNGHGISILSKNVSVMEIKFNNIIPHWAIRIVQRNNLIQQKISKFAKGIKKSRNYYLN
ncbi:hypothetical protein NEF87_004287 [Candidatus Lokiarchaeum ossiferum]|uniref:VTC domain-containing protein n=1 Tax=Candidatus Lokiarchaeum ossiferum TaxID=2951803 RepID=A0ABY6HWW2_9ARCH|nr:hypothetical protein NEF87_004287 [Candidatus Lokiarchaeum sp. B-35]